MDFCLKIVFIVFTGGPGAGKTTILDALARLGCGIIEETARKIIRERIGEGLSPRPEPGEFAKQIFDVDFNNYLTNIGSDRPIFFDRSFLDSAAMMAEAGNAYGYNLSEMIATYRFNPKVFIAPPWEEIYCKDDERDQNFAEAVKVYEKLGNWYKANGYVLIHLPTSDLDSRIRFVRENIDIWY